MLRLRLVHVPLAAALLVASLAAPSHAEPVPPEDRVGVTGWSEGGRWGDVVNLYGLSLSGAPSGTTITGTMSSCGRPVAEAAAGVRPDRGSALFLLLEDNANLPTQYPDGDDRTVEGVSNRVYLGDLVGPSYQYELTITHPDRDPYVLTGSHRVRTVRRPSCADIDRTVRRTIRVLEWSTLRGRPRVGHTVRATRVVTEEASTVRYRWRTGDKKVLSRKPRLRLTKKLRRQYVECTVTISQPGKRVQHQYLSLPRGVR